MNVERVSASSAVLLTLGGGLTALAAVNYADGVYGGATVAGIGGVVAFVFVLLLD